MLSRKNTDGTFTRYHPKDTAMIVGSLIRGRIKILADEEYLRQQEPKSDTDLNALDVAFSPDRRDVSGLHGNIIAKEWAQGQVRLSFSSYRRRYGKISISRTSEKWRERIYRIKWKVLTGVRDKGCESEI